MLVATWAAAAEAAGAESELGCGPGRVTVQARRLGVDISDLIEPGKLAVLRAMKRTAIVYLLLREVRRPLTARDAASILEVDYHAMLRNLQSLRALGVVAYEDGYGWRAVGGDVVMLLGDGLEVVEADFVEEGDAQKARSDAQKARRDGEEEGEGDAQKARSDAQITRRDAQKARSDAQKARSKDSTTTTLNTSTSNNESVSSGGHDLTAARAALQEEGVSLRDKGSALAEKWSAEEIRATARALKQRGSRYGVGLLVHVLSWGDEAEVAGYVRKFGQDLTPSPFPEGKGSQVRGPVEWRPMTEAELFWERVTAWLDGERMPKPMLDAVREWCWWGGLEGETAVVCVEAGRMFGRDGLVGVLRDRLGVSLERHLMGVFNRELRVEFREVDDER